MMSLQTSRSLFDSCTLLPQKSSRTTKRLARKKIYLLCFLRLFVATFNFLASFLWPVIKQCESVSICV